MLLTALLVKRINQQLEVIKTLFKNYLILETDTDQGLKYLVQLMSKYFKRIN